MKRRQDCQGLASLLRRMRAWVAVLLLSGGGHAAALPIPVPNGSFESPSVVFVSTDVDAWQKASKPEWYIEDGGFEWAQLTGLFKNPEPGAFDRIENCDGAQAIWVFAVPEVGLYQDRIPLGDGGALAPNALPTVFRPGSSYRFSAGIIGGGGGMSNGAPLRLSLYYRDAFSNRVTVASTSIVHSSTTFPSLTRLVEFEVNTAAVSPEDPWADQPIGIAIDSTVSPELQGGYWDVDAVRLTETAPLRLSPAELTPEGIRFAIRSEVGLRFSVATSPVLAAAADQWTSVATLTNVTGELTFFATRPEGSLLFWRAQSLSAE